MKLIYKSIRYFSLDHSNLTSSIITSGIKNYHIKSANIEGYLTKQFHSQKHTVIMIHQWWGLNQSITKTADIFSDPNIQVFVPDLYRNQAANSAQEAGHKMSNLNWPKAIEDLSATFSHFNNISKSVSIVGFCMGGALTFAALSSIKGWKAGGVFYGMPDFNIFRLQKITANVVGHFGQKDPLKGFSDVEAAKKLKKDCEARRYPIQVRIYQNANHAFCNQDSKYFSQKDRNNAFEITRAVVCN